MTGKTNFDRRDFLKKLGVIGAGLTLAGCAQNQPEPLPTPFSSNTQVDPTEPPQEDVTEEATLTPVYGDAYLAVARGEDIAEMTQRALSAIGGIERYVSSGADVIIKPNICTDFYPLEYGATTNPVVVATLVRLALGAGANRVRVMDNPFGGKAQSAYIQSGIEDEVAQAGGEMEVMNPNKFLVAEIPEGVDLKEWKFYKDVLDADVVINVPIAKHHGITRLTLGAKNLMGTIVNRSQIHPNISQRIADLVSRVRPTLTVVDAVRTLMSGGPTGGNLDDVRLTNTVIASADIVAADAYAATLFDLQGSDIGYIRAAANMGLGTLDLDAIKVEELTV